MSGGDDEVIDDGEEEEEQEEEEDVYDGEDDDEEYNEAQDEGGAGQYANAPGTSGDDKQEDDNEYEYLDDDNYEKFDEHLVNNYVKQIHQKVIIKQMKKLSHQLLNVSQKLVLLMINIIPQLNHD